MVNIVDHKLVLNPNMVQPGQVSFIIQNTTNVSRSFAVEVNGQSYQTKLLAPGESETLVLNLPVGDYSVHTIIWGEITLGESLMVR